MAQSIHRVHGSHFHEINPFDLSKYSHIHTVPENVKEDWLKGVINEIYHIIGRSISSYSTDYFESIIPSN